MDKPYGDQKPANSNEDVKNKNGDYGRLRYRKPGILSRLFYSWFTGLALTAWRRDLNRDDLFPLDPELDAVKVTDHLMRRWRHQEDAARDGKHALAIALFKSGASSFAHALTYEMLSEGCSQIVPILISQLLGLLDQMHGRRPSTLNAQEQLYLGLGICGALFLIQAMHGVFTNRNMWITCKNGMRTKIGLMGLVYDKTISITSHARQEYSLGRTVALMSTSINQVGTAYPLLRFLWFSPLQITFLMLMIYRVFGTIVLWILALLVLVMPLQFYIMRRMNLQRKVN
jgi:hypothetical protein